MRSVCVPVVAMVVAYLGLGPLGAGEETVAPSRVVAAGLFKNGLAAVKREVKLPGPGTYLLDDLPEPIHGTWWVESDVAIETRTTTREVETAMERGAGVDFQRALAGRKVTVHFRDGQLPPATGTVEALAEPKGETAWSRSYQPPSYERYYGWHGELAPTAHAAPGNFLVLKTDTGQAYLDRGMIAYVRADGEAPKVRQRKAVMLLVVPEGAKAATVLLTYLAKGIAWSPSYRVDISDPKELALTQNAVIKNELCDLNDAEIQLISGFPNIQFANVVSPLSPRTNWAGFFQQLNTRFSAGHDSMSNVVMQQVVNRREIQPEGVDLSAVPTGEGVDVHYQPAGKRTLKEGDALSFTVAGAKAPYERIVEWAVPDTRDANGRPTEEWQRRQNPERYSNDAWDAVRFRNPLGFPMTTGAATVVAAGRFTGQTMSYYVNAGEDTSLRVTKALSVRTRSVEQEEAGQREREAVWIGGHEYRKVPVKGELTVNNHRKEEIKLVIRRCFSGELASADGDPKTVLREEGVYSANPRREMVWTLALKPGEEKTFSYRYTVLVSR